MVLKNRTVQLWARRLHIYVSMALLLVVLFFSVTGITLNRPQLFERSEPSIEQFELVLPASMFPSKEGRVDSNKDQLMDFLQAAGVAGTASNLDVYTEYEDNELVIGEVTLDYKAPGYNAAVFIDITTLTAEIETTDYGFIALLNDLHKGRNSGEVWRWFIDITAVLMIFFVLTGVCLLVPKKKTFATSLKWTTLGSLISLVIYIVAVP
ncbi:PepSY-associated TM helix domain-containing protein [uncultured Vibrio sp.]|uniref:PepSY-associated TM helix domain-containing protein n=1 Tax=uncultured Vibrio sp. TaxID=114054 RepID=UPI00090FF46C|nr:PepSY-associated TM helix domain-containing protein [uncultured Vibrio sp.]OIQ26262.1 MAG: peptidase [Vibrio sp. MedPE-SWchi]